jgi:hypothetical protein
VVEANKGRRGGASGLAGDAFRKGEEDARADDDADGAGTSALDMEDEDKVEVEGERTD